MSYLGVNIYCCDSDQRRFLRALLSWSRAAGPQGIDLCLFRPFDARGPHLFLLFRHDSPWLREFLAGRIELFLAGCSPDTRSDGEMKRRHRSCFGKTLCAADCEPGMAIRNSYVLFSHSLSEYPVDLGSGSAAGDVLSSVTAISHWSLNQLETERRSVSALCWLSGVHRALESGELPSHCYWQYHAERLLPLLRQRITTSDSISDWLRIAVGEHNRNLITPCWEYSRELPSAPARVIDDIVTSSICAVQEKCRLLYEVNELVLNQLFQSPDSQIAMILYAWEQSVCAMRERVS